MHVGEAKEFDQKNGQSMGATSLQLVKQAMLNLRDYFGGGKRAIEDIDRCGDATAGMDVA